MRPLIRVTLVATALALASVSVQARDWGTDFSAEMVITNPKNSSQQKTAQFYSSKGRTRMESSIPSKRAKKQGMGSRQVDIVNPYQGAMWRVFPDVKQYMEQTGEAQSSIPAPALPADKEHACNSVDEVSCKNLGRETINGRVTEKWEITATGKDDDITTTIWLDVELEVPVRELVPGKMMREIRKVKPGALDEGLFQPPAGYEKIEPPKKED